MLLFTLNTPLAGVDMPHLVSTLNTLNAIIQPFTALWLIWSSAG